MFGYVVFITICYITRIVGCICTISILHSQILSLWKLFSHYIIIFPYFPFESCHKPTDRPTDRPTNKPTNLGRCRVYGYSLVIWQFIIWQFTDYWYYGKSQFPTALLNYQRVYDRLSSSDRHSLVYCQYCGSTKILLSYFTQGSANNPFFMVIPSHNRNPKIMAPHIPFFSGF